MNIKKLKYENVRYEDHDYQLNDEWDLCHDREDNTWHITLSVSPSMEGETTHTEMINALDLEIEFLNKVKVLINDLGPTITIETDFYWGDGDLLIRITIPNEIIEPLIKDI